LHRAPVHASPRSRCDVLSNADAKRELIQKKAGFVEQKREKINFTQSRQKETCRNLRSGEKFHLAGGKQKMVLNSGNDVAFARCQSSAKRTLANEPDRAEKD